MTIKRIISLSATGLDSPGLVSKITSKIFNLKGNVIDVEENCRRGLFSIFLIIDFSGSDSTAEEIKTVLNTLGDATGLKVVTGLYHEEDIIYPAKRENHIVTILGEDKPGIIAKISSLFHRYNTNIETCRMIAHGKFFSMEMGIDTALMITGPDEHREKTIERMKAELKDLCKLLNQSVVIQSEDVYTKGKKLIVFDVESTLIQKSSIKDFIEKIASKVRTIQRGTDFKEIQDDRMQALIENARILKGMSIADFEKFGDILELNPGTLELIRILKSMGFKIALLSSGFSFFIKRIFEAAGVDYAFANTLKADEEGVITGELESPVIIGDSKKEILEFIMKIEGIHSEQVIAVGDGSMQSHFIENVGLSIAFKPDDECVRTDGILSSDKIMNVLYCLGIPKTELDEYLKK